MDPIPNQTPNRGPNRGIEGYGNTVVTGHELADVLGLTDAAVRNLKHRGVFLSVGRRNRNEFKLGPCVQAYLQFQCGRVKSQDEVDILAEKAKKERANRILREILVEQTRGQLHHSDDVRAIVGDSNSQIRSKLLAMPNALTLQVIGQDDPAEVKRILETFARDTCQSLRDYDPQEFYRRSKIALALIKDLEQEENREAEER